MSVLHRIRKTKMLTLLSQISPARISRDGIDLIYDDVATVGYLTSAVSQVPS